jgi:O-antigen ligase
VNSLKETEKKHQPIPQYAVFLAYAYLFIYYTRPQDNIPGLNAVPWVGALFMIFTIWGVSVLITHKRGFFTMPIVLVLGLGVLFGISGIGAESVVSYKMSIKWMFNTFPQCVALVIVFSSITQLKKMHKFWVVIYFFMALITLKNAPWGPGAFSGDPNDAALALGMGLPFVYYYLFQVNITNKWRLFCWAALVLLFSAIIATNSRGGFLGVIAGLLAIWWMSRNRLKIMMFVLLGSIAGGGVFLSFIPENYIKDMQTISNTEDNTRVERIRTWEIGWEMFKANPILGVGAGNFPYTVPLYQHKTSWWTGREKSLAGRASHSLYFDIIPELGIVGVSIYFYIMCVLPLRLLRISKRLDTADANQLRIKLFCQALIASMAVYAVAGAFISVAYYPHISMWLVMYTIAICVIRETCSGVFLEISKKRR